MEQRMQVWRRFKTLGNLKNHKLGIIVIFQRFLWKHFQEQKLMSYFSLKF